MIIGSDNVVLKNGFVLCGDFKFRKTDVLINDGKIIKIGGNICADDAVDVCGNYVVPGFINLHVHGIGSYDSMDKDTESVKNIADLLLKGGVTGFLATTVTATKEDTLSALKNISRATEQSKNLLGIHIEGPLLNARYNGAHKTEWLCGADDFWFDEAKEASGGLIRIMTIAPECKGAAEFIAKHKDEVIFSLGHGGDDYEACVSAFESGAVRVTHLFNAMPPIHHRNKSLIAAAFEKGARAEIICDGIHVDKTAVLMALRIFGIDRISVITDGIVGTGLCDGKYSFCGRDMFLKDGIAHNSDGKLVGSTATMLSCIKNLNSWGVDLADAVKMSSYNPARELGISDRCGIIKEGADADIVILDKNLDIVRVIKK